MAIMYRKPVLTASYKELIPIFRLQNCNREFTTHIHKFKWLFSTDKQILNVAFNISNKQIKIIKLVRAKKIPKHITIFKPYINIYSLRHTKLDAKIYNLFYD